MDSAARLAAVRERIATAGRGAPITLVAVSKTQPVSAIEELFHLGVRDFGENRAQELVQKATELEARGVVPRWHFVGQLQRNKVASILLHVGMIHSVDRVELADAIARNARGPVPILVQVNIGNEVQKGGAACSDVEVLCRHIASLPLLELRGLMGMPPAGRPPRLFFEEMRRLLTELRRQPHGAACDTLSMGMSSDFEEAIACGATMVRVGEALFGPRGR